MERTSDKEFTRRSWSTGLMVVGALLLIPTLVDLIRTADRVSGTLTIGISPLSILGVLLICVGAILRATGPPKVPPSRPDSPDDSGGGA